MILSRKRTCHNDKSSERKQMVGGALIRVLFQILQCLHHSHNLRPLGNSPNRAFPKKRSELNRFVKPAQDTPEFRKVYHEIVDTFLCNTTAALENHYCSRLKILSRELFSRTYPPQDIKHAAQIALKWGRKNFGKRLTDITVRQFFDWIFDKRQPRRNPYNHRFSSLLDLHTVPTIPSLLDLQVRPTKPFHQILSWFNHSDTQYAPSNSHQRNILAEVRPHFTPLHWRNNLPEFRPYSAPTRHYIRPYGSRNNPQNGSSSSANRHLRPDPQSNNAHNNQSVNHTPLHKSSTIQGPLHQTPPRQAVADLSPAANHGPSITSPATTPASTPHSTPRKKRAQKMYYLIFPLHLSFQ